MDATLTGGSPVHGTTSRAATIVMVLAGAPDDPGRVDPDRVFFAEQAPPWDHPGISDSQT